MITLNLNENKLSASAIEAFSQQLQGELIQPGDSAYDDARKLWNGMFDKRPALIARCATTEDVVHAVNFARQNELRLAIKGGGHNSAGTGSCEGGLLIELSRMNKVEVDEVAKTAKAQGGCLLSELDEATQKAGLAVPSGIISHTGIGGLALGGGYGWISRKYGLTVDNMLSVEMVTAAGQVVRASADENPELFWAVRGGGGNFGVVTEFEFQCAEIGAEFYSGIIVKPFEDLTAYLQFHREYVRKMPDEMTIWMVIRHAPPVPFIPEEMHGKMVVLVPFVWLGDPAEGEALMQPVRDFGKTIGDGSGMHAYLDWQSAFDGLVPHGARNYWKSHHLNELSDDCIDVITKYAAILPTEEVEIFIPHLEGAPSRVSMDAMAFSHRKNPFLLNLHTRWQKEADDERCLQWVNDFHRETQPFSEGVYVNFVTENDKKRVRDAYTKEAWEKLVRIKQRWDPENLFRVNQNIQPGQV